LKADTPFAAGKRRALCQHTLLEFHGCAAAALKRVREIRAHMLAAVTAARGTIVKPVFHNFSPWGVSGVVVIAESHVTIHTWPEHGYAAVDIFSCSPKLDHRLLAAELARRLRATRVGRKQLARGVLPRTRPKPARRTMAA
jgi:S-adenosylmethionine decarboxylase